VYGGNESDKDPDDCIPEALDAILELFNKQLPKCSNTRCNCDCHFQNGVA
jgi:hypothetical protein